MLNPSVKYISAIRSTVFSIKCEHKVFPSVLHSVLTTPHQGSPLIFFPKCNLSEFPAAVHVHQIPGSDIWPSANQNEAAKINRLATVKPINKLFSDWFFMISLLLFLKGLKYLTTSTFTSKPTILYIFTLVSQTEVIVVISYINDDFSSQVLLSNSERAVKAFATHYIISVVCQ